MPYRDVNALRTRHATLTKDLAELQAKAQELAGLLQEEARVRAALAETAAMLRDLSPAAAPLRLETLTVAAPCSANWNDMVGDERARFCGKCEKNVYNLSAMTGPEAETLLAEKEGGSVCVRFFQRADGTVMTSDCPVGVRRRRVRRLAVLASAGGALSAAAAMMLPQGPPPCHAGGRPLSTSQRGELEARPMMGEAPTMGQVPMMGRAAPAPPPPPHVLMGGLTPKTR